MSILLNFIGSPLTAKGFYILLVLLYVGVYWYYEIKIFKLKFSNKLFSFFVFNSIWLFDIIWGFFVFWHPIKWVVNLTVVFLCFILIMLIFTLAVMIKGKKKT